MERSLVEAAQRGDRDAFASLAVVAPSPTPFAVATTFTSPRYGYSVTLPKDWMVVPATATWDGRSASGFDDPTVDQWVAPSVQNRCQAAFVCAPTLWAFAGPTSLDLAGWVASQDVAAEHDHGCGPRDSKTAITIDGSPATLERGLCDAATGPFLEFAYTVRNGTGYAFLLQDNVIEPRVETLDDADLRALLATIQLAP